MKKGKKEVKLSRGAAIFLGTICVVFLAALIGLGVAIHFSNIWAICFTAFVVADLLSVFLVQAPSQDTVFGRFVKVMRRYFDKPALFVVLASLALLYVTYLTVMALTAKLVVVYPIVALTVSSLALVSYFLYSPIKAFFASKKVDIDAGSADKPVNSDDLSDSAKVEKTPPEAKEKDSALGATAIPAVV